MGLLNQTAPCYTLSSAATKTGARVLVRVSAKEKPETCATFAAGAFNYHVYVKGLPSGFYEVEVVHNVFFKDGRVAEAKVVSDQKIEIPR